jgi:3'-5' exoribonuclease
MVEGIRYDDRNTIAERLSNNAIRGFVESVLADDEIAFPFISVPASRQHHHSIAGGLLQHSLECVIMVSRFIEFPNIELELGIVGALLHDIGKIRTLNPWES